MFLESGTEGVLVHFGPDGPLFGHAMVTWGTVKAMDGRGGKDAGACMDARLPDLLLPRVPAHGLRA